MPCMGGALGLNPSHKTQTPSAARVCGVPRRASGHVAQLCSRCSLLLCSHCGLQLFPLNFCRVLVPLADSFMAIFFSSLFERLPLCFSVVTGSWPISHQVVCAWPWLSLLLMPSVRCLPCFQSCVAALWAFPVAAVGACVWARMCPGQLPPRPAKE